MDIVILGGTAVMGSAVVSLLLRKFLIQKELILSSIVPIGLFTIGFWLRLSGVPHRIDVGYFFTEFSFLLTFILSTLALLLGQFKYWGFKSRPTKRGHDV